MLIAVFDLYVMDALLAETWPLLVPEKTYLFGFLKKNNNYYYDYDYDYDNDNNNNNNSYYYYYYDYYLYNSYTVQGLGFRVCRR